MLWLFLAFVRGKDFWKDFCQTEHFCKWATTLLFKLVQSSLYSHYKSQVRNKGLIGPSHSYSITFVSTLYDGSISDKEWENLAYYKRNFGLLGQCYSIPWFHQRKWLERFKSSLKYTFFPRREGTVSGWRSKRRSNYSISEDSGRAHHSET